VGGIVFLVRHMTHRASRMLSLAVRSICRQRLISIISCFTRGVLCVRWTRRITVVSPKRRRNCRSC
jgi:hypothetical protein